MKATPASIIGDLMLVVNEQPLNLGRIEIPLELSTVEGLDNKVVLTAKPDLSAVRDTIEAIFAIGMN